MLNLNPLTCESKYQTILREAGDDFIEYTKKAELASKALEYGFLNEKGKHDLEIILSLLFKHRGIKHSPMLIPVGSLLLIFMKPSEVYFVLSHLVDTSEESFKSKEK